MGIAVTHHPNKTRRVLVYDADCGFCAASARWLAKGGCEIESWQSIDDLQNLGLSESHVRTAAYWLEGDAVVDAGAGAIARALLAKGRLWALAGKVILAKPVRPIAEMVYRTVAANRHVMPNSTDACRVPEADPEEVAGGDVGDGVKLLWSAGGFGRMVIAALVAAQILVPLIALSDPPARFGFQMYSGIGGARIIALDRDGRSIEIDHKDILPGEFRPELSWLGPLPEAVCERVPAAAEVIVFQRPERRTVSCDR